MPIFHGKAAPFPVTALGRPARSKLIESLVMSFRPLPRREILIARARRSPKRGVQIDKLLRNVCASSYSIISPSTNCSPPPLDLLVGRSRGSRCSATRFERATEIVCPSRGGEKSGIKDEGGGKAIRPIDGARSLSWPGRDS